MLARICSNRNARILLVSTVQFSSVQSLSCVQLFVTPWTAACQASLSITSSRSPPKPMPIESVMPSNHLILCCPLLLLPSIFPAPRSFQMSQLFVSGGQNIGVSASTSVLPMNTQDWSLLGWTGWISLQSKGLSRVFSNTTVQKHSKIILWHSAFFIVQLSHPYMTTGKTIALTRGALMMLWKCCTQYTSKFGKLSSGPRTGKGQFSFLSQERQCQRVLKLLHNCTHLTR